MAQQNQRSSSSRERLHYFALPNDRLNWGAQKHLRCMKINPNCPNFYQYRSSDAPATDRSRLMRQELTQTRHSVVSPVSNSDHRINKAVPENRMVDLQISADRMRISMVEEKGKQKVQEDDDNNKKKSVALKPWNLRTRRAACKAPQVDGAGATAAAVPAVPIAAGTAGSGCDGGGGKRGVNYDVFSPVRRPDSRLRGGGGMGNGVEQKVEMPKFSFSLTKEEIENDFIAMTGAKPPRRPKRRPKAVQRKLNDLVPGFLLRGITPETYKVDANPEPRKGLK